MSELFREIDSELRQDKAREWLLRYGPRILIVCVIGIFLVAIGVYLREQEMERREAATAELIGIVGEGPDRPFGRATPAICREHQGRDCRNRAVPPRR